MQYWEGETLKRRAAGRGDGEDQAKGILGKEGGEAEERSRLEGWWGRREGRRSKRDGCSSAESEDPKAWSALGHRVAGLGVVLGLPALHR